MLCPTYPQVLTVGEVGVELRAHEALPDLASLVHPSFRAGASEPGASTSTVQIEFLGSDAPPNTSAVRFDAQGGLSAQPEGEGYRLGLHRRGVKSPHTVVCCDAETTQVKVYLGRDSSATVEKARPLMARVFTLILRSVLMNHLASRGGMVLHAAGGVIEGQALVFSGVSTAGKSTLMRSFLDAGLGESLLSDDRVIVRSSEGGVGGLLRAEVWGTPWSSGARVARNAHGPLAAMIFLAKADQCGLAQISSGKAMRRLMPTVSYPWYHEQRASQVLDMCARLVEAVPCYELQFSPGEDVVGLLCNREWATVTGEGTGASP